MNLCEAIWEFYSRFKSWICESIHECESLRVVDKISLIVLQ